MQRGSGLRTMLIPAAIVAVPAGCGKPITRVNAPPQGMAEHPNALQPFYTRMVDNAALADLSIADVHFVPHTAELNSLGTTRLEQLADLTATYAVSIRYEARVQNEALVEQRLAGVRSYLESRGLDMSRVEVVTGMPGSHDTWATEAIAAKTKGFASEFEAQESGSMSSGGE